METSDILIDAFGRIRANVRWSVDGLDAPGLAYRPDAEANSIAWLVWHLTRIQDDHVSEIADHTQVWHDGPWATELDLANDLDDTGYGHTSDQVANVQPASPAPLLSYHNAVADRTLEYLATVTSGDLDLVIDPSYDPPVTAGIRLVSVIDDCLQHAGQARYARGLYERQRDL